MTGGCCAKNLMVPCCWALFCVDAPTGISDSRMRSVCDEEYLCYFDADLGLYVCIYLIKF